MRYLKHSRRLFLIAAALLSCTVAVSGQVLRGSEPVAPGAVLYSLPSTTIKLDVAAEHESFVAGPYAAFAQKYLGIEARQTSGESYRIQSVKMYPLVEADPSLRVAINLGSSKNGSATFLSMTSQGLVITSDSYNGEPVAWRFPAQLNKSAFDNSAVSDNLDSRSTTLYKIVRTENGLTKVPVQQSQVVEKSLEKKAEQTANLIFKLRQTRIDIITGNTDATYNGEAMASVLSEIEKLESEYLSLFIGKSSVDIQEKSFDVVPSTDNERQMYIAFRISDTQGLLPAQNMGGRPIVLELVNSAAAQKGVEVNTTARDMIYYRKPMTVTAKLLDGQNEIMQGRVPVYQLGQIQSVPVGVVIR